jgi:hypothetical protein
MENDQQLCVDRIKLKGGKYTSWAWDMSSDELVALLWMVGEYGIRSSVDDPEETCGYEHR